MGEKLCWNVCKCVWNVKNMSWVGLPNGPSLFVSLIFTTSQGTLSDGRIVAVKQLLVASHHGKSQFVTEISTISAVQHRNLVKLNGCCIEDDRRLLVYEYLENGSLDQALFGRNIIYTHFTHSMPPIKIGRAHVWTPVTP